MAVEDSYFAGPQIDFVCNHNWPGEVIFNILHVVVPLPADVCAEDGSLLSEIASKRLERGQQLVKSTVEQIALKFPEAKFVETIAQGYPKETILNEIESWQADLAILGSHGRRELTRALIGSVSSAVLTYALCSVLVVRPPKL